MKTIPFFFLPLSCWAIIEDLRGFPVIETTVSTGGIRGIDYTSPKGNKARVFLGVPYGEPPVGQRRFLASVPRKPWNGTLDCTDVGPICWFNNTTHISDVRTFSEDCLNLNVHQGPGCAGSESKCPVLVYILGGNHMFGNTAEYPPKNWTDVFNVSGIVAVTVSYRYGFLGFWNTGTESAPGNAILHDIILALEWVQREIGTFGGDPDKVTLMGHSSGAMDVASLSLSPKTKGLFQQILPLSGSSQMFSLFSGSGAESRTLAERLGCTGPETLACMQAVPVERLIAAENQMELDGLVSYLGLRIDGDIFPESRELLTQKRRPIPMLTGTVQKETSNNKGQFDNATQNQVEGACALAATTFGLVPSKTLIQDCVDVYASSGLNYPNQVALIVSDIEFFLPAYKEVESMKSTGAPVWLYQLDYVRPEVADIFPRHADDVCYYIGAFLCHRPWRPEDAQVQTVMPNLFRNFILSQNPTPETNEWKEFDPQLGNYYCINVNSKNRENYHGAFVDFWLHKAPKIQDSVLFKPEEEFKMVYAKMESASDKVDIGRNGDTTALLTLAILSGTIIIAVLVMDRRRNDEEKQPLLA